MLLGWLIDCFIKFNVRVSVKEPFLFAFLVTTGSKLTWISTGPFVATEVLFTWNISTVSVHTHAFHFTECSKMKLYQLEVLLYALHLFSLMSLYMRDLSIHGFRYLHGPWNHFPMDNKGFLPIYLCIFLKLFFIFS